MPSNGTCTKPCGKWTFLTASPRFVGTKTNSARFGPWMVNATPIASSCWKLVPLLVLPVTMNSDRDPSLEPRKCWNTRRWTIPPWCCKNSMKHRPILKIPLWLTTFTKRCATCVTIVTNYVPSGPFRAIARMSPNKTTCSRPVPQPAKNANTCITIPGVLWIQSNFPISFNPAMSIKCLNALWPMRTTKSMSGRDRIIWRATTKRRPNTKWVPGSSRLTISFMMTLPIAWWPGAMAVTNAPKKWAAWTKKRAKPWNRS
mmetsp:Transcript_13992/g.28979  ORF Transcript_13992/g.28979 Transcript_13992/m.28979 type:complete len:258 (+) Transcript_13992:463-1236(+)